MHPPTGLPAPLTAREVQILVAIDDVLSYWTIAMDLLGARSVAQARGWLRSGRRAGRGGEMPEWGTWIGRQCPTVDLLEVISGANQVREGPSYSGD